MSPVHRKTGDIIIYKLQEYQLQCKLFHLEIFELFYPLLHIETFLSLQKNIVFHQLQVQDQMILFHYCLGQIYD